MGASNKTFFTWLDDNLVLLTKIVLSLGILLAIIFSSFSALNPPFIWEVAALLALLIFNVGLVLSGLSEDNSWTEAFENKNKAFAVGLSFIFLVALIAWAIFSLLMNYMHQHLFSIVLISLFLWKIDKKVRDSAQDRLLKLTESNDIYNKVKSIYEHFDKFYCYSDIPNVIAFGILLLTCILVDRLNPRGKELYVVYENLIGGAIAFQLMTSVAIYAIIDWVKKRT